MNEHAVPHEVGGYLFEFRGKRPLRDTARWAAGVCLSGAGAAIVVIGIASQSLLSVPLGIAAGVLGALVLLVQALSVNKVRRFGAPAHVGKHRVMKADKVREEESVASQLALIANLYSQGALTREEFVAAKRRTLDI
ncbi:hypothetical protein [Arthrobacter sp. OV608]|uniref:hypothetical protein n=1 Tax=Arthrobacter sp. OV608 TaxID=1882768 RepID=UPI00111356BF|nr:hypothetical protein [Arthrobacter sp. OV608]